MKKIILLVLSIVLVSLLYLSIKPYFNQPSQNTMSQTTTLLTNEEDSTIKQEVKAAEQSSQETQTSEITTITEVETTVDSLFNEALVDPSSYPIASVPENLLHVDIYSAINSYYTESYSSEEQTANLVALTKTELENLSTVLNSEDTLNGLDLTVDQVSMTLNNQLLYVPRVIVPVTYENAQRIAKDNDISILTEAMTEIGNRLIMIAYYNPQEDELLVYHLTNWTNPLFTYPNE